MRERRGGNPAKRGIWGWKTRGNPAWKAGFCLCFVDDDWVRSVKNSFWGISCDLALGLGEISEGEEAAEGAVVLAVETGLGVTDEFEVAGVGGEVAEGEGGLGVVVFGGHFEVGGGTLAEFIADGGFFETPGAELTPAGDGHGFDEMAFDGVGGLELELEIAEEADKAVFGFVGEDDGTG